MSSYWIKLFKMLEHIDEQIYKLTLFNKYVCLHSVFSIQLLEDYHHHHDDAELMIMSDLKDSQNKWNVKKVRNKQWIKNTIHYLIKWMNWSSEYNFYESVSHLADTLKAVVNYECRLKQKCKKVRTSNMNKALNFEDVIIFCKWVLRWSHMFLILYWSTEWNMF